MCRLAAHSSPLGGFSVETQKPSRNNVKKRRIHAIGSRDSHNITQINKQVRAVPNIVRTLYAYASYGCSDHLLSHALKVAVYTLLPPFLSQLLE